MEKNIKDLPNFVKDSKSKAIILKRDKGPVDTKIDNINVELSNIKDRLKLMDQTVSLCIQQLNNKVDYLEKILNSIKMDIVVINERMKNDKHD